MAGVAVGPPGHGGGSAVGEGFGGGAGREVQSVERKYLQPQSQAQYGVKNSGRAGEVR